MPRKPKENKEIEKELKTKKVDNIKSSTTKTKSKSNSSTKSASSKKSTTTKSETKVSKTTKKSPTKRTTTKSTSKKKVLITNEYYDLPYSYNQTVVKVLAQTPTTLFIYWEISDKDKENYKKQYGENFFETTKPVLIVYNDTLHYSFEVDINDFANSWYLHVNDSKSDYRIELGRRPIVNNNKINDNYIFVTSSNEIESPNDHILFDKEQNMVYFKNVKNNKVSTKNISNLTFIRNMGKIHNIYDLYKQIYKDENVEDIYDMSNPSSNTSSQFK